MHSGLLLKIWRKVVVIFAMIAVVTISFHHPSAGERASSNAGAIEISMSGAHSHDSKGVSSGLEEHSHPQAVLPAAIAYKFPAAKEPWCITNQLIQKDILSCLERPPRPDLV